LPSALHVYASGDRADRACRSQRSDVPTHVASRDPRVQRRGGSPSRLFPFPGPSRLPPCRVALTTSLYLRRA
jgi:hypothetical protein